jgi:phage repressor protein C with HTH and peptisase S24 domain
VLQATGATIDEFVTLLSQKKGRRPVRPMPMIGLGKAGSGSHFNERGFPVGPGWDEIAFPSVKDEHAYAIEISGHSLAPLYRKGDLIIVSPAATVRKGDRVVVKTKSGEVLAMELKRRSAKSVELVSLHPGHKDRTLPASDILWIARIVWSSQ